MQSLEKKTLRSITLLRCRLPWIPIRSYACCPPASTITQPSVSKELNLQQFSYAQHILVSTGTPDWGPIPQAMDPYLAAVISATSILAGLKVTATSGSSIDTPDENTRNILVLPDGLLFKNVPLDQQAFDVFVRCLVETRLGVFDKTPLATKELHVERLEGEHLVVCTHGNKDSRCGTRGNNLIQALHSHLSTTKTTKQYTIHDSSHVGGHDFAANLIAYPKGDWYGNLAQNNDAEKDAKSVIDSLENNTVLWENWRGRMELDVSIAKRMLAARSEDVAGAGGCGSKKNAEAPAETDAAKKETVKVTYVLQNGQRIEVDAELSEFTPSDPENPYFPAPEAAASEATSPSSEISLSDPSYDAKPTVSDETVSITFVLGTGAKETRQTVQVKLGDRLLEVAQKLNIPSIDGVCGGNMECATCHVIVDQKHFDVLPRASDGEEVMLEYAIGRVDWYVSVIDF
ncbi:hypothetical protein CcCBS67573_g06028 [Chytriomyces confervae]|uniref:2Fe-2S ferredoxin-type domain-containing protein n=1 Tax=Chytriomyces confervae TaxID=246404 RepID=A0A507F8N7_9FUNG|nr:hypothetical protein CcCBS67573_g06028 [Chytriomyces confervae]